MDTQQATPRWFKRAKGRTPYIVDAAIILAAAAVGYYVNGAISCVALAAGAFAGVIAWRGQAARKASRN